MISPFSRPIEELDQLIGPMIRERLQQEETLGPTWQDRPVRKINVHPIDGSSQWL